MPTERQAINDRLAYYGEQVLSFLDEIIKCVCPRCGLAELNISLVGRALVIRCSESLNNYVDDCELSVSPCDFIKVISPVNLAGLDYNKVEPTKRATSQNRKIRRKRTSR